MIRDRGPWNHVNSAAKDKEKTGSFHPTDAKHLAQQKFWKKLLRFDFIAEKSNRNYPLIQSIICIYIERERERKQPWVSSKQKHLLPIHSNFLFLSFTMKSTHWGWPVIRHYNGFCLVFAFCFFLLPKPVLCLLLPFFFFCSFRSHYRAKDKESHDALCLFALHVQGFGLMSQIPLFLLFSTCSPISIDSAFPMHRFLLFCTKIYNFGNTCKKKRDKQSLEVTIWGLKLWAHNTEQKQAKHSKKHTLLMFPSIEKRKSEGNPHLCMIGSSLHLTLYIKNEAETKHSASSWCRIVFKITSTSASSLHRNGKVTSKIWLLSWA
jgi:hypothetical protein